MKGHPQRLLGKSYGGALEGIKIRRPSVGRVRASIWGVVYLPPTPLRPGGSQNLAAEPSEGSVEDGIPLGRVG